MGFVKGNKTYFLVYMKNKNTEKIETCLFSLNVISKDINIIKLGINNKNITNYYLDNNKVLLSSEVDERSRKIKTLVVDLNNNRVKYSNQINVKSSGEYNRYVIDMRLYKNKIYLIMGDSRYEDYLAYDTQSPEIDYYIYVVNETDNKILYTGKITDKYLYNINFGILTKDEI